MDHSILNLILFINTIVLLIHFRVIVEECSVCINVFRYEILKLIPCKEILIVDFVNLDGILELSSLIVEISHVALGKVSQNQMFAFPFLDLILNILTGVEVVMLHSTDMALISHFINLFVVELIFQLIMLGECELVSLHEFVFVGCNLLINHSFVFL
jgi:hypothetical protein